MMSELHAQFRIMNENFMKQKKQVDEIYFIEKNK
jgi:hypothetical protein